MCPVTLPVSWVASTERCKDAASVHSSSTGATEDAAARLQFVARPEPRGLERSHGIRHLPLTGEPSEPTPPRQLDSLRLSKAQTRAATAVRGELGQADLRCLSSSDQKQAFGDNRARWLGQTSDVSGGRPACPLF